MKKTRGFLLAAGIVLAMAFTLSCSSDDGGGGGSCTNFKTVTIGTQTWMAENLNCDVPNSRCGNESTGLLTENNTDCKKYGRLYDWETATTACPSGWHLPSDAEWTTLTNYVGIDSAGIKLKAKSGWDAYENSNGTDEFGFSALPGGSGVSTGTFYEFGLYGHWWSATPTSAYHAYHRYIENVYSGVFREIENRLFLYSVRCVKD